MESDMFKHQEEDSHYNQFSEAYFNNLVESLTLFSLDTKELDKLAAPTYNPLFELETTFDEAFLPVCFESVFRNNWIDKSLKEEMFDFKKDVEHSLHDKWKWELIDTHPEWLRIRTKAIQLLDKIKR